MAGLGSGELRVPIFNNDNYEFWSIRMKIIFESHGLWDLVEKGFDSTDLKKADESDAKKKEKEESSGAGKMTLTEVLKKDAKALGLIQGAVSDEIYFLEFLMKKSQKAHGTFYNKNTMVINRLEVLNYKVFIGILNIQE
ncbi:unnamed protein product [Prunus armeniaca]